MDMETFLDLAKVYVELGWSIQGQLDRLDNGDDVSEQNPNALRYIKEFLLYAEKRGLQGTDTILDAIAAADLEED